MHHSCCGFVIPILLAFAVPISGTAGSTTNAPRIACDQPFFDFGEREATGEVVHAFVLRNAGAAPLIITRARSSCGCTTTQLADTSLEPGKTTELGIRFALRGRRGAQQKSVFVDTNDPLTPTFRLEFKGTATMEIDVDPPVVQFGVIPAEGSAERQLLVRCNSNMPFHITAVAVNDDAFRARFEPGTNANTYRVTVVNVVTQLAGSVQASLKISTDHPRFPVMEVPIYAYARSDLALTPPTLTYLTNAPIPAAAQVFTLYSRGRRPFQVVGIECPRPDMRVEIRTNSPDRYTLEIAPPTSFTNLNGSAIRVHTDLGNGKVVAIPIRVLPDTPVADVAL